MENGQEIEDDRGNASLVLIDILLYLNRHRVTVMPKSRVLEQTLSNSDAKISGRGMSSRSHCSLYAQSTQRMLLRMRIGTAV